ncbi:MAG: glutathione-disulfide reductase [Burkholderiales bacterium]|nr:MAG: glutathione-disulfide reductase [Burkholderiales bacterium]
MPESFDLVVIGGGSGGVRAARIAAGHGAKVALAEEDRYGGTCVIRGCVPKKLLVLASRFADEFERAPGFGWRVGEASFEWPALRAAKDRELGRLEAVYRDGLLRAGVRAIDSRAVLEAPGVVRLLATGESLRAAHVLVATGGRPVLPDIPGVELAITSNEVFDLPALPARMVIEGGGFIAVEFACLLQRLGVQVTLVYRGDLVLRRFDDDLRRHLDAAMREAGIAIRTGETIDAIERYGGALRVSTGGGSPIDTDQVMLAVGRVPNSRGVGLEAVGVELDERGAVRVTADSRTTAADIWAVGDVTDRLALTPVAIREGHAFADTVFGGTPWVCDHENVPMAVFSTPEIGTVGLTEAQARERFTNVDVYRSRFRPMSNALSARVERMLVKLVVDRDSDRVLGAHLCGPDAAEMIQLAGIALKMGATKRQFDHTVAVHPTAAEELVTMREPVAAVGRGLGA